MFVYGSSYVGASPPRMHGSSEYAPPPSPWDRALNPGFQAFICLTPLDESHPIKPGHPNAPLPRKFSFAASRDDGAVDLGPPCA